MQREERGAKEYIRTTGFPLEHVVRVDVHRD